MFGEATWKLGLYLYGDISHWLWNYSNIVIDSGGVVINSFAIYTLGTYEESRFALRIFIDTHVYIEVGALKLSQYGTEPSMLNLSTVKEI